MTGTWLVLIKNPPARGRQKVTLQEIRMQNKKSRQEVAKALGGNSKCDYELRMRDKKY